MSLPSGYKWSVGSLISSGSKHTGTVTIYDKYGGIFTTFTQTVAYISNLSNKGTVFANATGLSLSNYYELVHSGIFEPKPTPNNGGYEYVLAKTYSTANYNHLYFENKSYGGVNLGSYVGVTDFDAEGRQYYGDTDAYYYDNGIVVTYDGGEPFVYKTPTGQDITGDAPRPSTDIYVKVIVKTPTDCCIDVELYPDEYYLE